jgi:uncharacterized protein YggU (UPF0235/DUF167 family)
MVFDLFTSLQDLGTRIKVRVTPKAAHNRIKIEMDPKTNQRLFRVYVTAVPENGKANEAVLKVLAKELNLPISALKIESGQKTKDKIISITS